MLIVSFGRLSNNVKMDVLIVSQYFWPENFRINDLACDLVERGHQVTVLTGLPNYPDGKFYKKFLENRQAYSNYHGASVVRVPLVARGSGFLNLLLNYFSFALSASLFGAIKLRRAKFDIIFSYQPSPITVGVPAVAMKILKKAPLIFWVQDLWPETLRAMGVVKSPIFLWFIGRLVAFIYKRCDMILGQSKSFISNIRLYAPKEVPIFYLPNWTNLQSGREVAKLDLGVSLRSDDFHIMYAGNIGDAQDFPAVLSAAEHLRLYPNIKWLIVGGGRIGPWLSDEIKRRDLQEHVLMVGQFPPEMMKSIFNYADALLLSLRDESIFSMTIPSKLQAYLAAGIPIVGMINGEAAEIISESKAGLVCEAGDYINLAHQVLRLSNMSIEKRQDLGRSGKLFGEQNYARNVLVSRIEEWMIQLHASSKLANSTKG